MRKVLLSGGSLAALTVAASFFGTAPAGAIVNPTCAANGGASIGSFPYAAVTGDVIVCTASGNTGSSPLINNSVADNVKLTISDNVAVIAQATTPPSSTTNSITLGNNATFQVNSGASLAATNKAAAFQGGTGLTALIMSGGTVSGTIVGADHSTVTIAGTILGGFFSNVVTLSGDNNRVILNPGYSAPSSFTGISGGSFGATNTVLELGGAGSGAFDTSLVTTLFGPGGSIFSGFTKFEKTGASTWTLTNAPNQATPWTLTGGTLSIASDAALGAASGGGLTFNGGTLAVTASAAGSRAVTVNAAGGTVNVAPGTTTTWIGIIGGSGAFTVANTGTLSLMGASPYSGTLTVNSGSTLALSDIGSIASAKLVDNGTFNISGITATSATLASLSGSGSVIMGANQTLVITNGSGIYTGGVTGGAGLTVSGGQFSENGISFAPITVSSGGILKGTGTVHGVTVNSGGTVAPGNSIGTLNVKGNLAFASGSIYQVEVDAAGNSDQIAVAQGSATIATGAAVNVVAAAGTYATSTNYTILTADGGITGNFGSVTSNLVFLTPTVVNTGNSVVLTLVNNTVVTPATPAPVTFPSVAVTPNQIASSTALQALGSGSLYNAVLVSTSVANALAAFDASSGEIHATLLASQFEAANNARRTVLERMRRQTRDEGWSVWGSVGGDWGNLGANGNAASANRNGVDVSVGADGSLDDHWRGGIEGGYNGGNINIADRASHAHLTGGHVGAYAWGNYGDYVLRTGFSWGFGTAHTSRAISFTGFSDAATASENTKTVLLYGEAGYDIHLQDVMLEPYMGLAWTQLNAGSFRETGGAAALSGASKDMDNGYFSVGLNANTRAYSLGGSTTIAPLARIAWQHGFNSITASRSLAFIAGGPSFTVLGTPLDGDRALLDIGATLAVSSATEFSVGYYGALGGRANDHAVKLLGAMHL